MVTDTAVNFIAGCTGKIPYFSRGLAMDTLRKFKKQTGGSPKIYSCVKDPAFQPHWHLTTQGKKGVYRGAGR